MPNRELSCATLRSVRKEYPQTRSRNESTKVSSTNRPSVRARVVIEGGTVKSITYSGQYTVSPDGTGRMALSVSVLEATTPPPIVYLDFVITKARFADGVKVATEIQDALEGPSVVVPGQNSFVTHVFTRRPDRDHRR